MKETELSGHSFPFPLFSRALQGKRGIEGDRSMKFLRMEGNDRSNLISNDIIEIAIRHTPGRLFSVVNPQ
jgi:hypothetical protein